MPWIKLDDQWMDHPKIIRAGRDAREMWLASLTWCARHLTDGFFPEELLPSLAVTAGVDVANCQQIAKKLLEVCLWERIGDAYHIHDYTDYNPTKEQAEATKKARSEAGRAGGIAKSSKMSSKSQANGKQNSAPSPSPSPSNTERDKGADAPKPPASQNEETPTPKGKRKPVEFHDPVWDLMHGETPKNPPSKPPVDTEWCPADIQEHMAVFLVSTGLPAPINRSDRGYWIKEMRANREYGIAPTDVKTAIMRMRADAITIKSPASIRAVALDAKAAGSVPKSDPDAAIRASIYRPV